MNSEILPIKERLNECDYPADRYGSDSQGSKILKKLAQACEDPLMRILQGNAQTEYGEVWKRKLAPTNTYPVAGNEDCKSRFFKDL